MSIEAKIEKLKIDSQENAKRRFNATEDDNSNSDLQNAKRKHLFGLCTMGDTGTTASATPRTVTKKNRRKSVSIDPQLLSREAFGSLVYALWGREWWPARIEYFDLSRCPKTSQSRRPEESADPYWPVTYFGDNSFGWIKASQLRVSIIDRCNSAGAENSVSPGDSDLYFICTAENIPINFTLKKKSKMSKKLEIALLDMLHAPLVGALCFKAGNNLQASDSEWEASVELFGQFCSDFDAALDSGGKLPKAPNTEQSAKWEAQFKKKN